MPGSLLASSPGMIKFFLLQRMAVYVKPRVEEVESGQISEVRPEFSPAAEDPERVLVDPVKRCPPVPGNDHLASNSIVLR
jgi:hypothetical protein